jgi:ClpP class serine protease
LVRDGYEDLARWSREKQVSAVVLDINGPGGDPLGLLLQLACMIV